MLTIALMAVGAVGVAVAWRLVAASRASVFPVMSAVTGAVAVAALATGRIDLSRRVEPGLAAAGGLGAGAVLYLATVAFVLVVGRWPVFDRHVGDIYAQRRGYSLPVALALAGGVVAPAEEIFWRGLFLERLADPAGWALAGALTWGAYALANAASGSLPVIAAAVVGGGAWTALAVWTRGVLAGVLCHAAWTALMIVRPPGGRAAGARAAPARAVSRR